jgi:putative nucleotidyltransferase with HDIG domain
VGIGDYLSGRLTPHRSRSGMFSSSHGSKKLRERDEMGQPVALSDDSMGPLGLLFCFALIAAVTFILDYGVVPPSLRYNTLAPENITARLDFQYNDPSEAKNQRDEAARRAPRVYNETPNWVDDKVKDLTDMIGIVEVSKSVNDARDRSARYPTEALLVEELFKYNEDNRRRNFLSTVLLGRVRSSLQIVADDGIMTEEFLNRERNKPGEIREIIRLPAGANSKVDAGVRVKVENLNSVAMATDRINRASWTREMNLPPQLLRQLLTYFQSRIDANLVYNQAASSALAERALQFVGEGEVPVKKGALIVAKDQLVGRSEIDRLHEEYKAYKASLPLETRMRHLAGIGTLAFTVLMTFIFIISRIQQGIFRRRRSLIMLGLFSITALAAMKVLMLTGLSMGLAPFVFMGIVASLAFGQTMALMTLTALMILATVAGVRWEAAPIEVPLPALVLAMMIGGVAAALPAEQLKDRRDLLRYAFMGGVVQFVLALGMSQLGGAFQWNIFSPASASPVALGIPTIHDATLALLNGPICGLLVLGGLPVIEWLFGILTNIRLFELADMNQPALRRIQMEAPGTFAHTLQVRNLAEPAADAIGANTRLVSAGVLYHDLGKTMKPEYFVENQMNAEERHRRLRPSVSALLITAHVKDGIELAREYGLPQQIIDFIPEHHGTTLVSYFYHTARKDAETQGDASGAAGGTEPVQEAFFRYPGPKPQSRETAIVMIADTIEAATRTLINPSAARLKGFVHELIMDKMLDGQLDESNLTFAELALIEEAFLRVMVTRFHNRIRYPGQEEGGDGTRKAGAPNVTTTVVEVQGDGTPVDTGASLEIMPNNRTPRPDVTESKAGDRVHSGSGRGGEA